MKIQSKFVLGKFAALVGAALLLQLSPLTATAQQEAAAKFDSLPIAAQFQMPSPKGVNMKDRKAKSAFNEKTNKMIRFRRDTASSVSAKLAGDGSEISTAQMNLFIDGFLIPSMAQTNEQSLSELGKNRKDMFRQFVRASRGSARSGFISKLIVEMKKIVEGNYHPACRVNALVVLSELNRAEGNRTTQKMPHPEPSMLAYMLEVLDKSSKDNSVTPAYLTPTALAGIERHAAARREGTSNPIGDSEAKQIGDVMMKILALDPKTQGIDSDVVDWNKRRAVRVLGTVGNVGANAKYAVKLRELISDDKASAAMRVDAVAAYGLLSFSSEKEAMVKEVALEVAALLAEFADEEADYIEKKINEIKFTVIFLDGVAPGNKKGSGKKPGGPSTGTSINDDPGSGSQNKTSKADIPEILPAYHRELVKRRIMNRIAVSRGTLGGVFRGRIKMQSGLKQLVSKDAPEDELLKEMLKVIETLKSDADVFEPKEGDKEEAEDRTESYAGELKNGLRKGAEDLRKIVDANTPKEEAAAGEDPAAEGQ